MSSTELLYSVLGVLNALVELYLGNVIKPFLHLHEHFYSKFNQILRKLLDDNNIPEWFTANFITYIRTVLVVPCVLLLAWGHIVLPCIIVLLVDFGDFLDGVVARYWVDVRKELEEAAAAAAKDKGSVYDDDDKEKPTAAPSPVNSDDDSYEVVTTGSPHTLYSWTMNGKMKSYGGFVDAVCDKAFVVPCWLLLIPTASTISMLRVVSYITFWCLILAETSSAVIRFRAFFTSSGISAPAVKGLDFSTSAVKADHIGKAKQTFEMLGTALFIVPFTRYLGLLLLALAVPLAYESVRRKCKKRVMYVDCYASIQSNNNNNNNSVSSSFDHRTMKFWMQVKGMGSKLIVGVPTAAAATAAAAPADMVLNACATACVDQVVAEAPTKVDLMFLEKTGIDYVVILPGQDKGVTDEVIAATRCLVIGEDGIAHPVQPKDAQKKD